MVSGTTGEVAGLASVRCLILVPLQRAGDTWNNFRGYYILLPRAGITLNIFLGGYVLVLRVCNTENIPRQVWPPTTGVHV